ncbi:glycosyltransferase family A protein [Phaeobacter sp.]|uniref:glycosyltransferase family 2 protein n=1 Tax=Phaeobacter sp. TaxID=1902409 RepID=UPI0025F8A9AD|nr:glycosyltransferase family A protein [Phaeobacter sp.]
MSDIKLSICIPTFNRGRYLRSLLAALENDIASLPWAVEIIVSDNASDDDTAEILAEVGERLPLRSLRQSTNVGAVRNVQIALRAARGEYAVYLADDDRLRLDGLVKAIALLDANPAASILYAPWTSKDLVTGGVGAPFYQQKQNVQIAKGDFVGLLEHILDHHVFAEIAIMRASAQKKLVPIANDLMFWAFTTPAEYLGLGDVIFAQHPFYHSITRHFEGDTRAQQGTEEVQTAWDRYRGGLEHLFGLALQQGRLGNIGQRMVQLNRIVTDRMRVALRLRMASNADPLETYALASRLRGMGVNIEQTAPLDQIRLAAALQYICVVLPDLLGADGLAVIGSCPEQTLAALSDVACVPLRHVEQIDEIKGTDIVFNLGEADTPIHLAAEQMALSALTEGDLMRKFA